MCKRDISTDLPALPKSVFITGISGFIGKRLAQIYQDLGAEVRGVDSIDAKSANSVVADISLGGPWQKHADGCELFIHTAALLGFAADPDRMWEVNVRGTEHALEAAKRGGARRLVHLSTIAVYGISAPSIVSENFPVRFAGAPYVDTKIAAEHLLLRAHAARELACTILRLGDIYGPESKPWTVAPVSLLKRRRFALPEYGEGLLSPIFVDDVVEGIRRAGATPAAEGRILNLTDGIGVSTKEFFGFYARMLGVPLPLLPTSICRALAICNHVAARCIGRYSDITPYGVGYLARRSVYSNTLARDLTGYKPKSTLAQRMEETKGWLSSTKYL